MPSEGNHDEWFTDDLSVPLPPGRHVEEIVSVFLGAEGATHQRATIKKLAETFDLTFDAARLCCDRVGGGVARARSLGNEPDPDRDPIAYAAYRHMTATTALSPRSSRPTHSAPPSTATESVEALASRIAGSPAPARSADLLRVLALIAALPSGADTRASLTRQVSQPTAQAIEALISGLAPEEYPEFGSPTWFEGHALVRCARALGELYAVLNDPRSERVCASLQARAATRLFSPYPELVGPAMLYAARLSRRLGDIEDAVRDCDAVIADFARIVDACAHYGDVPTEEEEVALRHAVDAIDLRAEMLQDHATHAQLRQSATATLLRIPHT